MNKYISVSEEELKNKITVDYFSEYDCTKRVDNIDFWVMLNEIPLLWAESKKGKNNITDAFIQLVLTIGQHQTYTKYTTPAWLAAFDATCISFLPYSAVMDVFGENDFNWNVTPSNHQSKEFIKLKELIESSINSTQAKFYYETDSKELHKFIKKNISSGLIGLKVKITKSSFVSVFFKWMEIVKPTITVEWDDFKREGILPRDFYLADLLSQDGVGLIDNLSVLLNKDKYKLRFEKEVGGQHLFSEYTFNDEQKAYNEFWNKYERPPKKEYWDYIIQRADLLVPQDVRERKGSYFTPKIWVGKSQEYLAEYLGDDWQDQYYIWDCCAGTGNMEFGLYNKYRVWASTIDSSDVSIMRERITNGANLLEEHIFKFDFLNDSFSKLPENLKKIIDDPEKRKKLIIYINPPYKEHSNAKQISGGGKNIKQIAKTEVYQQCCSIIGTASRELFAQFMYRIYTQIPDCILANFSTLKNLQGPNFEKFRNCFRAKLERLFIVPANTFDNVKGEFPIGFFIWNTSIKEQYTKICADVYNSQGDFLGHKSYQSVTSFMVEWLRQFYDDKTTEPLGFLRLLGSDIQNNKGIFITSAPSKNDIKYSLIHKITKKNVIPLIMYNSIRHCIEATWLNDRDQFLYPNDEWKTDKEFQTDCLIYTLFHNSNNVKSSDGTNHWIPFYEEDVNAKDAFDSHFMADFIAGKMKYETDSDTLIKDENAYIFDGVLSFSDVASQVLNDGKMLWKYYHEQPQVNVNASFYEIKEYFQGRDAKGKMNKSSEDTHYNELLNKLRENMKLLTERIASKVYKYGFLMR